ncbi:hypothetical protein ACTXG7_11560 [Mycolicibacterium sp. Dal123E01]|uniref:hypothetical protein n=1 Tax=Mycolicibacterium sp. Dal123E01 TaxID=3457578 RepID=UPI00403EB6D1
MRLVYLHGIGKGDPDKDWLSALNRALEDAGHPAVDADSVIAPRYAAMLKEGALGAKMPPITYKAKNEELTRCEFERRQARVQRSLQRDPTVGTFGFGFVPDSLFTVGQSIGDKMPFTPLPMVGQYVDNESVRGAVLKQILRLLPDDDDIMLIAHSLGSVIAIDLLDHLPTTLHVRRFITLGSPANSNALHKGHDRLLKKFPYARVDDWSNFFSRKDGITRGRGLASMLPGAQDFLIDINGIRHASKHYLAHPAVASLVADVLYPAKRPATAKSEIAVRLNDEQALVILQLHFARAVAKHVEDEDRARRYRDALRLLQDDLASQLVQFADSGHPLPMEFHTIVAGGRPALPHRWELREAVLMLAALSATNFVAPYEIDTEDAPLNALPDIAFALGLTRQTGDTIASALADIDKLLKRSGGIPWGRIAIAGAGLAMMAAGPIGLMAVAPASAYGAAAIAGGLAGFGPGGMVGGLAMLGGLAGGGAAMAAGAIAARGSIENITLNVTQLKLRVGADLALKRLGLPVDDTLWEQLTTLETQIAAELNRLEPFSDAKSTKIAQLRAAKETTVRLLGIIVEHRLGGAAGIGAAND